MGDMYDGLTEEQAAAAEKQLEQKELLDRINTFLYKDEQLDASDLNEDLARVAEETGLTGEQVHAVVVSVLTIMEERRKDRGIESGGAFPAYRLRRHTRSRHFWGRDY